MHYEVSFGYATDAGFSTTVGYGGDSGYLFHREPTSDTEPDLVAYYNAIGAVTENCCRLGFSI